MSNINITLVPFTKGHLIPKSGKYLVKTVSTSHLKIEGFLQARCELIENEKGKHTAIDVSNQIVTHISIHPIL